MTWRSLKDDPPMARALPEYLVRRRAVHGSWLYGLLWFDHGRWYTSDGTSHDWESGEEIEELLQYMRPEGEWLEWMEVPE